MTRSIALLALLTLGACAKHLLGYAAHKRTRREQREAVHTWEAEGGAVPVGRSADHGVAGAPRRHPTEYCRGSERASGALGSAAGLIRHPTTAVFLFARRQRPDPPGHRNCGVPLLTARPRTSEPLLANPRAEPAPSGA